MQGDLKNKFRALIQSTLDFYAEAPLKRRSILGNRPSLMGPNDAMCPVTRHMLPSVRKRIKEVDAKWCRESGRTAQEMTLSIKNNESWIIQGMVLLQAIEDVPHRIGMGTLEKLLTAEYRDVPAELWGDLQKLHDVDVFWTPKTISPGGKQYTQIILRKWADPKTLKKFTS